MNELEAKAALRDYTIGFTSSVVLTLIAYFMTINHVLGGGWQLALTIVGLAVIQLYVQLKFFLHVSAGTKPRWKIHTFWFMLLIILVVIGGSLWVMHSLNYRMMPSQTEMENYMKSQNGGI